MVLPKLHFNLLESILLTSFKDLAGILITRNFKIVILLINSLHQLHLTTIFKFYSIWMSAKSLNDVSANGSKLYNNRYNEFKKITVHEYYFKEKSLDIAYIFKNWSCWRFWFNYLLIMVLSENRNYAIFNISFLKQKKLKLLRRLMVSASLSTVLQSSIL